MKTKFIALIFVSFLLQACDHKRVPQATTEWDDPLWQANYKALKPIQTFALKGRIGISNPQDSFSSNFHWQQNDYKSFKFRMYGAFGNTYALMNSTPDWTSLETADERFFEGPNASLLIAETLGWKLPLNYLSDWIKGVPTGVGRDKIAINADGTLQSLTYIEQSSIDPNKVFNVSYEKYLSSDNKKMPAKIRIIEGDNKLILSIRTWEL